MCQTASKLLRIHLYIYLFSSSKTKLLIFRAAFCLHLCVCYFCCLMLSCGIRLLSELYLPAFHMDATSYQDLCPKAYSITALNSKNDITEWANSLFLITRCSIKHLHCPCTCENESLLLWMVQLPMAIVFRSCKRLHYVSDSLGEEMLLAWKTIVFMGICYENQCMREAVISPWFSIVFLSAMMFCVFIQRIISLMQLWQKQSNKKGSLFRNKSWKRLGLF